MRSEPEPAYPVAALEPGEGGEAAEDAWQDDVLTWGRTLKAKIDRGCRWAERMGAKLPFDCPAAIEPE